MTASDRALTLTFGAMAPPLIEQILAQGFNAPAEEVASWDELCTCATRLSLAGVLTERETRYVRGRIADRVADLVDAP